MTAFAKLLGVPGAALGYHIALSQQERDEWMRWARESPFPENRARYVRNPRMRNRQLVRALRNLGVQHA